MRTLPFTILAVYFVAVTDGFLPTYNPRLRLISSEKFRSTRTHRQLTEDALKSVVDEEIKRQNRTFTETRGFYIDTDEFRNSKKQFLSGVEEIDSMSRPYRPEEHVDGEQIYESHNRLRTLRGQIRNDIRAGKMNDARRKAGNALHTVQDFYSHSNWLELGNNLTNSQFGSELASSVDMTAGPGDETCTDCGKSTADAQCERNSHPADSNNKLTSGYNSLRISDSGTSTTLMSKPAGKCSHGGPSDQSASQSPIGGINKDTSEISFSPHFRYHSMAAELAKMASITYIKNIRDQTSDSSSIEDVEFAEFLGLVSPRTLCFVVDTTGSMSGEIGAVRTSTIQLVNDARTSAHKPGDYVLVPFNDPDFGPVMKTKDPNQMISWLSGLTAHDGGDEPEMAMNGMLLAAGAARPSSTCFVYTDAPAKDIELFPVVQTLAVTNRIKFDFILTNLNVAGRKRRSLSRQKRSVSGYYDDLASSTGGSVLRLPKSDVSSATAAVVSVGSRTQQVTVLVANNADRTIAFYVDSSLDSVVLQISGSSVISTVKSPTGTTFSSFTLLTNSNTAKLYSFGKLTPGLWNVTLSSRGDTVIVTGSSPVNFDYKFTIDAEGSHGGFQEISGKPIVDTSYFILTTLYGGSDSLTGAPTNLVANITSLNFLSTNGLILATQPLLELDELQAYVTDATKIVRTAFRVALTGFDPDGNVIHRVDQTVYSPASTNVFLEMTDNTTLTFFPGSSLTTCINVTSESDPNTWFIRVSDTLRYYSGESPISVFLNTGESILKCLNFSAPRNAQYGAMSTVTVTVGGAAVTSVDNYLVFYLTTDDIFAPEVAVTDVILVDNCSDVGSNCEARNWTALVTAKDADSGMRSLSAQPLSTSNGGALSGAVYTFSVGSFGVATHNSVSGTYTATCCYTTAAVRAVDVSGNVREIVIGKAIKFVPRPTNTPPTKESSTQKSRAAGQLLLCTPLGVMLLAIAFLSPTRHIILCSNF